MPPDAFQRLQDGGVEITGEREAMVGRVSAPAGKDIEIGHEDMRTAAPAHQHAYAVAGAVEQHDRRCVTRPCAPLRRVGGQGDAFAS